MRRSTLIVWGLLAFLFGQAEAQTSSRLSFDSSGHFLIQGQPQFVRGVYDSGIDTYTSPSDWDRVVFQSGGDIRGTRSLGSTAINMYLNYQQGQDTLTEINAAFAALQPHGVLWLQTTNCFQDRSYKSIPFSVDQAPAGQLAGQLALNSQMAGYYVMDECSDSGYGSVNLVPETQQHYAALKSYDPQGIVMAVPIAMGYRDPKLWTQPAGGPTADLFATDPYPLYNAEPATGYPHFTVADYIARLRDSVPASKPIAGVLQLFKFTTNSRLPTYAEMRMHAYSAIVEGAQGLFWWDIGTNGLRSSDNSDAQVSQWSGYLRSLVNELASLEPALVAPATPSALVGNSSSTGDPIGWRKAVVQRDMTITQPLTYSTYQWYQAELDALNAGNTSLSPMLHQPSPQSGNIRTRTSIVNGIGYVIAYNYTNVPATVTLTWQSPLAQVTVLSEGRALTPSNASFTDSFGAYETHVYQVTPSGSSTPPPPPPAPAPVPAPPPAPSAVTASLTNPANGASVSGTTTVSVGAGGGTPPYSYNIAVDGAAISTGSSPSTSWVTTNTANGSHTVTATVTDSGSPALAASASIQVTVANSTPGPTPTPPPSFAASFSYPASSVTTGGNQSVGMATTATWGQAKTFTLTVDGAVITNQSLTGTTLWIEWDTTAVGNGNHTLALAVAMSGQSATATLPITVSNSGAGSTSSTTSQNLKAFTDGLYQNVLGRTEAASEAQAWVGYLTDNPNLAAASTMIHAFFDGAEFRARPVTPSQYVAALYQGVLGRVPDSGGLAAWASYVLEQLDTVLPGFVNSPEFQAVLTQKGASGVVVSLYQGLLGRAPDQTEIDSWTNYIAATGDVLGVVTSFVNSAEYLSTPRTLDQFVTSLYRGILGRDPGSGETTPSVNYLAATLAGVEDAFITSAEFQARFQAMFK